jgi:hypothetical protein
MFTLTVFILPSMDDARGVTALFALCSLSTVISKSSVGTWWSALHYPWVCLL